MGIDAHVCMRFMPSSWVCVRPIQFVILATLILASPTLTIALIIDATLPIFSVCLRTIYGTSLLALSTSLRRYCPLGDRMRV